MNWRFWRRRHTNGTAAKVAKAAAERRLRAARRDWPKVEQTRDDLSALIEAALRGRGV